MIVKRDVGVFTPVNIRIETQEELESLCASLHWYNQQYRRDSAEFVQKMAKCAEDMRDKIKRATE